MEGYIATISVESHLAIPIKIIIAFDLAIPLIGIYPINMLIYVNEAHKGLFIVCNSKILDTTQGPILRELFTKRDASQEGML